MWETVRQLWPYLRRYRRALILGLAALVAKDILAAMMPLMIKYGVDALIAGFRVEVMLWFLAGLMGFSIVKGIFNYWTRVILIGISRDVEYDLRGELFDRLVTLSADFYARFRTGDIMARSTSDLNSVRMLCGPGISYSFTAAITFLLAVVVMGSVDWQLTAVMLLPTPVVSFAFLQYGQRVHFRFSRIQALFADLSSRVQENISGVRIIRSYVQEEREMRRFEDLSVDLIDQNLRLVRTSATFMPLMHALIGISFLLVLWAGGYRVMSGELSIGGFLMFNFYMGMLVFPMIAMGWVVNILQRGSASMKRLNSILQERPAIDAPRAPAPIPHPLRGEIEFRNVTVRRPAGEALRGIDLRIPGGATVAIVGQTGGGKSTLVHLIPRLIDPTEGSVLLDGVDLRTLDPAELRRQIGYVPQETFLFSTTLAENIAFGVEEAPEEDIRRVAELAGLGPDVAGFPDGYQTMIGERGITLSGGQKQRTAIARAILRNPSILILDDALSSVDTMTEERILRGLSTIMRDRTTVLISHRVSTVRHADRIFVIAGGRVAETGTHQDLLASSGYYAELHEKQLLEEELEAI